MALEPDEDMLLLEVPHATDGIAAGNRTTEETCSEAPELPPLLPCVVCGREFNEDCGLCPCAPTCMRRACVYVWGSGGVRIMWCLSGPSGPIDMRVSMWFGGNAVPSPEKWSKAKSPCVVDNYRAPGKARRMLRTLSSFRCKLCSCWTK